MSRRGFALAVTLAIVGLGLAWLLGGGRPVVERRAGSSPSSQPPASRPPSMAGAGRIVCAAPSVTELVFALGQGHRVVGVTDFCSHPPEGVKEKPRIGGLFNPNFERILNLQPDLIVTVGDFEAMRSFAASHGIAVCSLQMNTLDEIRASIRVLGESLACPEQAAGVLRRFDAELDAVRARVRSRSPRRVYFCTNHQPADLTKLCTCGSTTFLAELLTIAGGENIFADAKGSWPQISKEVLVKRRPEVILDIQSGEMGIDAARLDLLREDWQGLPDLPAVRNGSIHFLTEDFLFIPSVRSPAIARRMAEVIHPEAFRE